MMIPPLDAPSLAFKKVGSSHRVATVLLATHLVVSPLGNGVETHWPLPFPPFLSSDSPMFSLFPPRPTTTVGISGFLWVRKSQVWEQLSAFYAHKTSGVTRRSRPLFLGGVLGDLPPSSVLFYSPVFSSSFRLNGRR